ncbi:MAG: adenine phosphoribosyltransferase [Candidatus Eremiobacteraeota bacterium]|nr:adenine phosphoribosyltransferase [Candidatus Eremiobacteraeota bacterium]
MAQQTVEAYLKEKIRDLPDWPVEGVLFRDITPVLEDPEAFKTAIDSLSELMKDLDFSKIVAVESRGFIFGGALAHKMGKGFVIVRKPGKLPCETIAHSYELEYGKDTLEMHNDSIKPGEKVVILDDLIATGGSAKATAMLVEKLGGKVEAIVFLIELEFLKGKEKLKEYDVFSVVKY